MDGRIISLIVEIILDSITIGLSVLLFVRAKDNRYKRIWAVFAVLTAVTTIADNIYWIKEIEEFGQRAYEHSNMLSLNMIIRWYIFLQLFTLFVLGSFRPGWMTGLRITAFSLPLIITSVVVICYWWFGPTPVILTETHDIFANIGTTDIQIRLGVFIISAINPLVNMLLPFYWKWKPLRKPSKGMYIYASATGTVALIYIIFSLDLAHWVFFVYDYITIGLLAILTIIYMRHENPFSLPPTAEDAQSEEIDEGEVSPVIYRLRNRLTAYIRSASPYTDPDFSPAQLARELNTSQTLLGQAIKYAGYTCFREYINFLRLEHFKHLAASMPGTSIKELMYRSGFTSRSSFYRHFAEQESMTPKRYLENLYMSVGEPIPPIDEGD